MMVILIMVLGMAVGKLGFPAKLKGLNEKVQLICTLLIIFSMGVMLGERENFPETLSSLGSLSILFFAVPTLLSMAVVYLLTKRLLPDRSGDHPEGEESGEKGKRNQQL